MLSVPVAVSLLRAVRPQKPEASPRLGVRAVMEILIEVQSIIESGARAL
jgi:hypothetical protein